jgi:hypothetical protein
MKLDDGYEFAALSGKKVRLQRGAETYTATVRRPVLLWELRGDDGTLHLLAPDATWSVTPIDEAPKAARQQRVAHKR